MPKHLETDAQRSASADWWTTNADGQQRQRLVCRAVHQVQRKCSMKTPIHQHSELELYSVCDIEPVELVMQ